MRGACDTAFAALRMDWLKITGESDPPRDGVRWIAPQAVRFSALPNRSPTRSARPNQRRNRCADALDVLVVLHIVSFTTFTHSPEPFSNVTIVLT